MKSWIKTEPFEELNVDEKRTLYVICSGLLCMVAITVFYEPIYRVYKPDYFVVMHTILEVLSIIVSFSMALQGWLVLPHMLSRRRLMISCLFLMIGTTDLMHAFTYEGMGAFSNVQLATWLWIMARTLEALGLLTVYAVPDNTLSANRRAIGFGFSFIGLVLLLTFTFYFRDSLPVLITAEQGPNVFKKSLEYGLCFIRILVIALLFRRYLIEKQVSYLSIMNGLVILLFGGFIFTLYKDVSDIYNLFGHLYKIVGYFYLLKGIYMAGIEEPFLKSKKAEEKLFKAAYFDDVTGLPNRKYFQEKLESVVHIAGTGSTGAAVILLDIDRFKIYNDSLGHAFGDIILANIASRLRTNCSTNVLIARMGGDEFAFLLSDATDAGEVAQYAENLIREFGAPFLIDGRGYSISASAGISVFDDRCCTAGTILKQAEIAMYRAKKNRSGFLFYSPQMNDDSPSKLMLESDLRMALERNQFSVYYQPKFHIGSKKLIGLEALIRWQHPVKGLVLPGSFISTAEETGLIIPIGEWVMFEACRQLKVWQEAGLSDATISVNLSPLQFYQANLVAKIERVVRTTGIDPRCLELEITEGLMMEEVYAKDKLNQLRGMGIQISIDDFGTGYSSLSYLKRIPVDRLKIDRSFIKEIHIDSIDTAVVTAIMELARLLNLKVIAEGVETKEQVDFLIEAQCDEVQGYYFSPPLVPAEFEKKYVLRKTAEKR